MFKKYGGEKIMPETVWFSSGTSARDFQSDDFLDIMPQDYFPKALYMHTSVVNLHNMGTFRGFQRSKPTTQEDLTENEDNKVQNLIFRIRTSHNFPHPERIATRLLVLFDDGKEEDPSSFGISYGSLRNFYDFLILLKSHTEVKYPTIALTPDHTIYVSWRFEGPRIFSTHFLPNADVRFVVFRPNERHSEKQIRNSGTQTADTLMETVATHGVWSWISE